MALNIGFSGKIYDTTNSLIDAYTYGFISPQNKWSSSYTSQYETYSLNLGDGGWLTQTGTIQVGNNVILKFKSIDGAKLGCFLTTLTSSALYIKNIQLKQIQNPTVSVVCPSETSVNTQIHAIVTSSDEYQWNYNGITMYHKISWYGTNIFNNELGIVKTEYNWGDGYTENSNYSYLTTGEKTLVVRVTNKAGLQSTASANILVLYNAPEGGIELSNNMPYKNDVITITATISDPNSKILYIEHYFDGVLVATNQDIGFSYIENINEIKQIEIKQKIYWFDGQSTQIVEYIKQLQVLNHPPICSFTYTNEGMTYKFVPTYSDIDGEVQKLAWKIDYKIPFLGNYDEILNTNYINKGNYILDFPTGGEYKVTLTAIDDFGAIGSYSDDLKVDCGGTSKDIASSAECVFLNDRYYYSNFAYSNNMNNKFDYETGVWSSDDNQYLTRASDIMMATAKKYNLTFGNYSNPQDIMRYIRYIQTYDTKLGKFLVYSPGITPLEDSNNFELITLDEKQNYLTRGIQVYVVKYLEILISGEKGITVPFSQAGMNL